LVLPLTLADDQQSPTPGKVLPPKALPRKAAPPQSLPAHRKGKKPENKTKTRTKKGHQPVKATIVIATKTTTIVADTRAPRETNVSHTSGWPASGWPTSGWPHSWTNAPTNSTHMWGGWAHDWAHAELNSSTHTRGDVPQPGWPNGREMNSSTHTWPHAWTNAETNSSSHTWGYWPHAANAEANSTHNWGGWPPAETNGRTWGWPELNRTAWGSPQAWHGGSPQAWHGGSPQAWHGGSNQEGPNITHTWRPPAAGTNSGWLEAMSNTWGSRHADTGNSFVGQETPQADTATSFVWQETSNTGF